jgi:GR25 family glycosyltransferase involved in LPS biosynthesis
MNVIYINLKHRIDRKKSIIKEIEKINGIPHLIDAVLNTKCGHIGCGESHILALEYAIQHNFEHVMILEDDFVWIDTDFSKCMPIPWDVLLLSKAHHWNKPSEYDFLERACHATTTSGYIIRRHYYSTLLENFKESVEKMKVELKRHEENCIKENKPFTKLNYCSAIDQNWSSLQDKDIFYMFPIGKQGSFWSDNNCLEEQQFNEIYKIHKETHHDKEEDNYKSNEP